MATQGEVKSERKTDTSKSELGRAKNIPLSQTQTGKLWRAFKKYEERLCQGESKTLLGRKVKISSLSSTRVQYGVVTAVHLNGNLRVQGFQKQEPQICDEISPDSVVVVSRKISQKQLRYWANNLMIPGGSARVAYMFKQYKRHR
jgi:hypothetical protein